MARPIKKGIDYFPLDVDFLRDIKIRKVMRACGSAAPTILICLLGNIYRDEGYYMKWDEDTRFLVADDVGTSEASVDEVVKKSIQVGIFDSKLYDQHQILTSHGIQERYKKAAYQKSDSSIDKKYDLLNVNHIDNGVSNSGNSVNHAESTQSKVNESKEEESKGNNTSPSAPVSRIQEEFAILWGMHPRKVGDQVAALDTYKNDVLLKNITFDQVKAKIEAYKKQIELNGTQTTYIKTAGKWFTERCWNNEYDTTPPKAPKKPSARQEPIPKWAQPDYQAPAQERTPEQEARDKAQIEAALKKLKEGRDVNAS